MKHEVPGPRGKTRLPAPLLALALAAALGAWAFPTDRTEPVFPFDYEKLVLDNGFTAYLVKGGAPGIISHVNMVRTGSRDEVEPGRSGFAHFFEHMMFRGTERYPDYDGVTSTMGAARNAFTSNDMTVYYLTLSNEYLELVIDLEADRFQNLRYTEDVFRTEAGAILGEYQQGRLSPFRFLDEATRAKAWDYHTYGHTTIGLEPDIRAMPEMYDYSLDFYRRHYRPENVVLVLAGDFDTAEAKRLIRQHYEGWAPGYVAPAVPVEPRQTAPRDSLVVYPGRTLPILAINYKSPAWSATDTVAVALEVLGRAAFGPNSEISRRLVLQERRVQYLAPGFGLSRDPGLVSLTTMVRDPDDVDAIEAELLAEVERFRTELVDPATLAAVRSNMKYGFLMGLEEAQGIAFSLIPFVINTGTVEAVEDYFRTLDAVTPGHMREAARRYLVPEGRTTMTMVQAEG
jgi:zinc protease